MESSSRHGADEDHQDALERLVTGIIELSRAGSVEDIAAVVRTVARDIVSADGATFTVREGGACRYVDENAIEPLWKGSRFPLDTCISGWCMTHAEAAVIPDITSDPRIPLDAYRPTFVRSLVMLPVGREQPPASIGVYWQAPHEATEREVKLLQALADSTAVAMENVRLAERLERRVHDLERVVQVCAWTGRVKLGGEWVSLERYLQERLGVEVSHGISDEAVERISADPKDSQPK